MGRNHNMATAAQAGLRFDRADDLVQVNMSEDPCEHVLTKRTERV